MNRRDDETLTREMRVPGIRRETPPAPPAEREPLFERVAAFLFLVLIAALVALIVAASLNQAAWRIGHALPTPAAE